MRNRVGFVEWLRAFAVGCIIVCHLVQACDSPLLNISAQFFNIGVELFILISGYCFGIQKPIDDTIKWYRRRLVRIYLPYELFCVVLFLIYLVLKLDLSASSWLLVVLGIKSTVKGSTHVWFIAVILMCYLITPVLDYIFKKKVIKSNWFLIVGLLPVVFSFVPNYFISVYLPHSVFFSLAYYFGTLSIDIKKSVKKVVLLLSVGGAGIVVRVLGRIIMDGSIWYDRVIVIYTQYVIAIVISLLFMILLSDVEPNRTCRFICDISFEVYLYHYMLIVGPISLMKVTPVRFLNCCLVVFVSVAVAYIMKKASDILLHALRRV